MIECFTDVDVGTLYYAVRQLAQGGLLTAVAHERVTRGGMRTIYRITSRSLARNTILGLMSAVVDSCKLRSDGPTFKFGKN